MLLIILSNSKRFIFITHSTEDFRAHTQNTKQTHLISLCPAKWPSFLKALDAFENYQRPVFSLGVSRHTLMWSLKWSSKLLDNNGKNTLVAQIYPSQKGSGLKSCLLIISEK